MSVSIQRASASEGFRPGASIPLGDHDAFFPLFPLFQISPLFSDSEENFHNFTFLDFHPPKFLTLFFKVVDHKF